MMARTKHTPAHGWWDDDVETVPVTAARPKPPWRRRVATIALWAAIVLLPLSLMANLGLVAQRINPGGDETPQNGQAALTTDVAQAQLAVETWVQRDPSPLPGGRVMGFVGSHRVTPQPDSTGEAPGYDLVTYNFLASDRASGLYQVGVQMTVTPAGDTAVVGTPAALPLPAADGGTDGQGEAWPWPGITQGDTSPKKFEPAVQAWAEAYTSGDPGSLKQAVGDPDPNRAYQPLSQTTLREVAVGQTGQLFTEDQNPEEDQPRQILARVNLTVAWASQPADPNTTETLPEMTLDLLLDRADTAAPVVVAWGAPGQPLTPYGNAVIGRTVTAAASEAPEPSGSPSATPNETPR